MNNPLRRFTSRIAAVALALCAYAGTAAQAVDLRSWDQKIDSASQRFVVLSSFNDQAVLDKETQLVWQRAPGTQNILYSDAVLRCGRAFLGSRAGWRLPTSAELMSLIDPSITNTQLVGLPPGHPFVSVRTIAQGFYWTMDPYPNLATARVVIAMVGRLGNPAGAGGWGGQYAGNTNPGAAAWCVRGPASPRF